MSQDSSYISSSEAGANPQSAWSRFWIGFRMPAAAASAIALIVCFEWFFVYNNRSRFVDPYFLLIDKKRENLTNRNKVDEVAIFGDSRYWHVEPEIVRNALGGNVRVTNYTLGWSGIETFEAMLRGLLTSKKPPKLILINPAPEMSGYGTHRLTIAEQPDWNLSVAKSTTIYAALRTTVPQREWKSSWDIFTQSITPMSMAHRTTIRPAFLGWIFGSPLPGTPEKYYYLIDSYAQQGSFYMDELKTASGCRRLDRGNRRASPGEEPADLRIFPPLPRSCGSERDTHSHAVRSGRRTHAGQDANSWDLRRIPTQPGWDGQGPGAFHGRGTAVHPVSSRPHVRRHSREQAWGRSAP
jgi:hypothetical protein